MNPWALGHPKYIKEPTYSKGFRLSVLHKTASLEWI